MNYFDLQENDKDSKFIEKAVEIKRRPIIEIEEEQKENNLKITALNNLKKELISFDTLARQLYGFQSIFKNKTLISSDEEIMSGKAFPYATAGNYSINIKQIATAQRLISKDFSRDILVPASTIKIKIGDNEATSFFGGGDVKDLMSEFKNSQPNINPILVNKNSKTSILILASIEKGTNNTIELLEDNGKVLVKLGFFEEEKIPPLPNKKKNAEKHEMFWNSNRLIIPPQNEADLVLYNNSSRKIDGERYLAFRYYKSKITNQTKPELQSQLSTNQQTSNETISNETISHKTISNKIITNQIVTNQRLLQKDLIAVLNLKDDQGNERLVKIKLPKTSKTKEKNKDFFTWKIEESLIENNVSYHIEKIIFVNPSKEYQYTFHLPEIYYKKPKFNEPKVLEEAKNLVFNYEGIDIERANNTVTNFIDGVELFFKKPHSEKIDLQIVSSTENSANLIIDLINQYNKCLHLLNVYLFSIVPEDLDESSEKEKKFYSLFRSDSSVYNLRSNLRNIMSYPYETSQGKLLLSAIGTKSVFFREQNVDNNKIQIEEEAYIKTFQDSTRLQSISEMFSYDKDKDGKIDSGIAFKIRNFLKPYVSYSDGSFFKSKINIITQSSKYLNDRIAQLEEEVEDYREDLEEEMIQIKQAEEEQKRAKQFFDAQKQE